MITNYFSRFNRPVGVVDAAYIFLSVFEIWKKNIFCIYEKVESNSEKELNMGLIG